MNILRASQTVSLWMVLCLCLGCSDPATKKSGSANGESGTSNPQTASSVTAKTQIKAECQFSPIAADLRNGVLRIPRYGERYVSDHIPKNFGPYVIAAFDASADGWAVNLGGYQATLRTEIEALLDGQQQPCHGIVAFGGKWGPTGPGLEALIEACKGRWIPIVVIVGSGGENLGNERLVEAYYIEPSAK